MYEIYVYVYIYLYPYLNLFVYICLYMSYTCIYMYVFLYVYTPVYIYIYLYMSINMSMCIYIYNQQSRWGVVHCQICSGPQCAVSTRAGDFLVCTNVYVWALYTCHIYIWHTLQIMSIATHSLLPGARKILSWKFCVFVISMCIHEHDAHMYNAYA